jgi:hypothetical protein
VQSSGMNRSRKVPQCSDSTVSPEVLTRPSFKRFVWLFVPSDAWMRSDNLESSCSRSKTRLRPTRLPVDRICERRTKSSLATYAAIISCVGQSRLTDACRPSDTWIPLILKTKAGLEGWATPMVQSHLSYSFQGGWRREWDSKTPANVGSTTYSAADGSFRHTRQWKAMITAG